MTFYNSIDEKIPFFANNEIVKSKEEVDKLINEEFTKLTSNQKLHVMFRGVNNAKYKLYNSFQRLWGERRLGDLGLTPQECILKMLQKCQSKDNPLAIYMEQLGVIKNDWLILSFLQHYNAHTPLIDFSRDPKVALFFACKDVAYKGNEQEIDNYTSIYYYKTVDVGQHIPTLKKKIEEKVKRLSPTYWKSKLWTEKLSFSQIQQETDVMVIPSKINPHAFENEDKEIVSHFALANLNSTNQQGEFALNMDIDKPLEEKFIKGNGQPLIFCVNIHKGLTEYIIRKYLGGTIEEAQKLYFKDEYDIAREAEYEFLSII